MVAKHSSSRNPYARGGHPSALGRTMITFGGGLCFTTVVLLFLAFIQPSADGEKVALPQFAPAFKVERDPAKPPAKPQQERRKPLEPKKRIQEPKKVQKRRTPTQRAARPSTDQRSPRPLIRGAPLSLGSLAGGGGPVIEIGGDGFSEVVDEIGELLAYERLQEQIRESRGVGASDDSDRERKKSLGVAKSARRRYTPKPAYPPVARQRNIEGIVQFRALVGLDGRIEEYEILRASPKGYFEETVEEEVIPKMIFDPAEDENGKPLPSWEILIYRFRLEDA